MILAMPDRIQEVDSCHPVLFASKPDINYWDMIPFRIESMLLYHNQLSLHEKEWILAERHRHVYLAKEYTAIKTQYDALQTDEERITFIVQRRIIVADVYQVSISCTNEFMFLRRISMRPPVKNGCKAWLPTEASNSRR